MESRHRSHTRTALSGSFIVTGPTPEQGGPYPYTEFDASVDDFIGKKKDEVTGLTPSSPFYSFQRKVQPPLFSYYTKYSFYPFYTKFTSVPGWMDGMTGSPGSPPGGWSAWEPSESEAVAKTLANTNPFRYTISVPVMILELVDATSLLKFAAKTFSGLLGGAYLNWRFGYMTMLQDIKTLASITKAIEARVHEFNDLVSKGGSRKRVFISARSTSTEGRTDMMSNGYGSWGGPVKANFHTKVWGSVHWRPKRDKLLEVQALTDFNSAVQHVLDLDSPDPSTVWEAIPFSWLVDYFVNIGDSLKAVESTDLVIPSDLCIMRERSIVYTSEWDMKSSYGEPVRDYSGSKGGKVEITMKNRSLPNVGDISDLLHFGFMSKSQAYALFGLLASLRR